MGNVRKGQQGGGIESHADALAKGKEKGGQSESLSGSQVENGCHCGSGVLGRRRVKFDKEQLSPFIKETTARSFSGGTMRIFRYQRIYARAVEPIKKK